MLLTVDPAYAADVDPAWVEQVVMAVLAAGQEQTDPHPPPYREGATGRQVPPPSLKGRGRESSPLSLTPPTPPAAEVSVTVGNEALLHDLNKRYRGVDRPTDVLAFPLHGPEDREPFVTLAAAGRQLGDVVISYPRVQRQARAYGHTEQHELAYLLIHGVLHLVGYDHHRDEDFAAMREQEERILGQLGLADDR